MNNSSSSAWTAIDNRVYDLTGFLHKHPGGYSAIAAAVGRDGSGTFSKF